MIKKKKNQEIALFWLEIFLHISEVMLFLLSLWNVQLISMVHFWYDFQSLIVDITRLQDDIDELQSNFAEDLITDSVDPDTAEQLAMQSTLLVLSDRLATIHMKASGKQQILEVYIYFTD